MVFHSIQFPIINSLGIGISKPALALIKPLHRCCSNEKHNLHAIFTIDLSLTFALFVGSNINSTFAK